jgi:hypothetical protein
MHRDIEPMTGTIRVFFEGVAVILLRNGFAEFAAVRLGDFDFPSRHGNYGDKKSRQAR